MFKLMKIREPCECTSDRRVKCLIEYFLFILISEYVML